MLDIFGDIYKGFTREFDHIMRHDSDYERARNRGNLIACYNTQIERKTMNSFKAGFKSGLLVAFQTSDAEEDVIK